MFLKRVLITVTLGPLAILLVYLGGLFYFVPLVIFLAIAVVEFTRISTKIGWRSSVIVLLPLVIVQYIVAQWFPQYTAPTLVASFVIIMCYGLWLYESERSQTASADWLTMTAGLILLGWVAGHFLRLRGIGTAEGNEALIEVAWVWTTLAMLGTWFADSFAYLVGKFVAGKFVLGKHKMSPRLSPNKTIEGYFGGVVFGTMVTLLIGYIFSYWYDISLVTVLLIGLLTSVVSPAGDLSISLLKRQAGVKDSGNLFPGHGGALDRIDSLMWSVTFVYYLLILTG
ncbi:MAG: phosphatidate cytidylyltransferase [Anaerolineae bacterium]|nr:phosphatidate cytidylyltransferase [Anaerolineae bacterium]